jgi:hypothetical protein
MHTCSEGHPFAAAVPTIHGGLVSSSSLTISYFFVTCCSFVPCVGFDHLLMYAVLSAAAAVAPAVLAACFSQTLQSQHDELEKAFRKERAALEEKYAKLYGEQLYQLLDRSTVDSAMPHYARMAGQFCCGQRQRSLCAEQHLESNSTLSARKLCLFVFYSCSRLCGVQCWPCRAALGDAVQQALH